ncbi:DedA family protein [Variovorax sp. HJSM1_2]|uniref:DedA family protein n=1 Tax=Variovorax sp. HJSM1_2 TaxID=3366263 RepID=UPI003BC71FCA
MHLPDLIQQYGYYAIASIGIFENDTMLLTGAYAARQGYLQLHWVMACAAGAAMVSDLLYFYLARRHGQAVLQRYPALQTKLLRVLGPAERHPVLASLAIRYAWGLRAILPLALGLGRLPAGLFVLLSAVGAVVWAIVFGLFGTFLVALAHQWLGDLRPHEHWLLWLLAGLVLLGLGALVWRFRAWRKL